MKQEEENDNVTEDNSRYSRQSVSFDGVFNDAIRKELIRNRHRLGISLQQLGEFLRINWSTIRKWECGTSQSCHARHVSRISNFLNHIYDERLREINEPDLNLNKIMKHLPPVWRRLMERTMTIYGVCQCYPGESLCLIRLLAKSIDKTAKQLLERSLKSAAPLEGEETFHRESGIQESDAAAN